MQENTTAVATPPSSPAGQHAGDDAASLLQWIARELHDVVVQPLTTALVELELMSRHGAAPSLPDRALGPQRELRTALHGLRQLMGQLRGQSIEPVSLVPSVTALIADVSRRTGLDAHLLVSPGWPAHLAPETSRNLRRIIEEALRNVIRHSDATWVEVRLDDLPGGLKVSITDDGASGPDLLAVDCGTGTRGMHERAVVIGGVLSIDHAPSGSTVAVVVAEPAPEQAPR